MKSEYFADLVVVQFDLIFDLDVPTAFAVERLGADECTLKPPRELVEMRLDAFDLIIDLCAELVRLAYFG